MSFIVALSSSLERHGPCSSPTISVNARSAARISAPAHSASTNASHGSSSSSASCAVAEHVLEAVDRQRLDQRLLGGEVAVDRADADLGAAGDVVHLRLAPLLGEDDRGRGQDPLAVAPCVGSERAGELGHENDCRA